MVEAIPASPLKSVEVWFQSAALRENLTAQPTAPFRSSAMAGRRRVEPLKDRCLIESLK